MSSRCSSSRTCWTAAEWNRCARCWRGWARAKRSPIRQIYIPPQAVQIVVYAPEQEVTGDQWVAQYTELPGYYVTETTLGYLYPDRWTLSSPAKGLYQWQRVPAGFQRK